MMKPEPPYVLHNPIDGPIFLPKCQHESSKNVLSGDGTFEGDDTR